MATNNPQVDFPPALRLARLAYASAILLHLRQRQDLNLGHIGEQVQPLISAYRTILPEFLNDFYELVSGLLVHLEKYANLAESCSKSGAYQDRRQEQLNVVLTLLVNLEKDKDVLKMLKNMCRQ